MNSHTNSPRLKTIVLLLALLSAAAFFPYRSFPHTAASAPQPVIVAAHWSEQPQILARQRGNPWINVLDGREVLTAFAGPAELKAGMESNQSHPLALATADFDEDGTPDIVAGYSRDQRGSASFMRGNVDAVYSNSPEAKARKAKGEFTDTPFLGPARLFVLPATPDFLAAGDFDADGHYDLVTAAHSENAIYFLKGNGHGAFAFAKRIELAGPVTAMLADDFNRRDGLNDLMVAVQTKQDAQLLIFEHPYGAMKAQPESFTFAAPITSLATGFLEGDARIDLAIAAGNELGILRGRDRKLLFDESGKQAEVLKLTLRKFDFGIAALAIGEFLKSETPKKEIALLASDGTIHLIENSGTSDAKGNLSGAWREREAVALPQQLANGNAPVMLTARVSARPVDTLVVGAGEQIHLLSSDVVPPKSEHGTIDYAAQGFDLAASLDMAGAAVAVLPLRLNVDALSDLVVLRTDSVAPAIVPTAPMATFTVVTTADDITSPTTGPNSADCDGSDGVCASFPRSLVAPFPCLGECTYRAARDQANLSSGASAIVFAVPGLGTPVFRAMQYGILNSLTIDGTTQPGGFVEFTGQSPDYPATHVATSFADSCVFRGMVANGFDSNNSYINLQSVSIPSSNHIVEGNRIGTNVAGTVALGDVNSFAGVVVAGEGNLVGGTTLAARNIISTGTAGGVAGGVYVLGASGNPNRVLGNFIGTDVTGTLALGNRIAGVTIQGMNAKLGGTGTFEGNVISGTALDPNFPVFGASGVELDGDGTGVLIQGNRIGTNAAGTAALGNVRFGIYGSAFDTIGGTTPAARNIISGNGSDGLNLFAGAGSNQKIVGNYVGTNAAGDAAIPNGGFGLQIFSQVTKLIDSNTVSGNVGGGVHLCCNSVGSNDIISNNKIGTDSTGTNPLGNTGVGLQLGGSAQGGSILDGLITGNTIAANGSHGILIDNGFDLVIRNNFIGTTGGLTPTLGNLGDGIRVTNVAGSNNTIGGSGAENTIAFNGGNGINLATLGAFSQQTKIGSNSIFSNNGLGIDLGDDGVTANDDGDIDNGVNTLQNYPTLTYNSGLQLVQVAFNSTANTNFDLDFYSNLAADPSGNGEGQTYLATRNVTTDGSGNANFGITFPVAVPVGQFITATATRTAAPLDTSEFSNAVQITGSPTAADASISGTITDNNGAPVAGAVINLNGAQSRATITNARGYYQFASVEVTGFYTLTPSRANYSFNPFSRSFSQLGNHTDAGFTASSSGDVVNPLDTPEYFVRQHYLDFLGREPDESGFNFWSDQILECGNDAACRERRAINVSAAYFLSLEFRETGGLVDGLYRASYGRRPHYSEFMPDSGTIARDVVVGRAGWAQQLEANKQAFIDAWAQRPAFLSAYGALTNEGYIDTLISHTGVSFGPGEREALVSGLNSGASTRADTLRQIAENDRFVNAKRNEAFVMMQYFGYLRRDPDAGGYQFWLNKLNQFDGNFEQAEMVKAFLVSGEYRQRFR